MNKEENSRRKNKYLDFSVSPILYSTVAYETQKNANNKYSLTLKGVLIILNSFIIFYLK